MVEALSAYYRCPAEFCSCFGYALDPSRPAQFFHFRQNTAYGRLDTRSHLKEGTKASGAIGADAKIQNSQCLLPFDPDEVVENLRLERYPIKSWLTTGSGQSGRKAYYALRSVLPFRLRKYLKRVSLRGWERKAFPSWPVDRTVDKTLEQLMLLAMDTLSVNEVPFIWFWPKEYLGCVLMTHDVETTAGLEFCPSLINLNDHYGIKASFQIIPKSRYVVTAKLLQRIRERGCEVNVHDWNHDGRLFSSREVFLTRVAEINRCATEWGAEGFRSGALYRNLSWCESFTFSYDLSVPNLGHLDAQPGGCCTVKPYFIGRLLEIPVTTTQDYMLFYLLGDYSVDLWKRQVELILESNGVATFIVHPDYILKKRERKVYEELLDYLSAVRLDRRLWMTLPGDINRWWRDRSKMNLVCDGSGWRIEGPGSERACLAYARRVDGQLVYSILRNGSYA
jgi:hypothetical protein